RWRCERHRRGVHVRVAGARGVRAADHRRSRRSALGREHVRCAVHRRPLTSPPPNRRLPVTDWSVNPPTVEHPSVIGDRWAGDVDAETTQDIAEVRRFVVRGDDSLAYRLADELANRHRGRVTVILSGRHAGYGPRLAHLEGVEIVVADQLDGDPLEAVDLPSVEALALLARDDVANMDAALR